MFTIKLQNSLEEWKPLVKIGNYGKHPRYGEIIFTPKMLDEFVINFESNVLGKELSFNYNHNGESRAALWVMQLRKVKDAEGKTIALEYLPKYTKTGKELIDGEEFKYVSLEFAEKYQDKGAVLFGGACTNNPFLTGEGLTLLEDKNIKAKEEKDNMDMAEITKKLEAITAENANLKAEMELQKKLSVDNEAVKKLQADVAEKDRRLLESQMSILKYQLEAEKAKWRADGIPGGMIEAAEKRCLEASNKIIKLENSPEEITLLSYTNELFSKLPTQARVPMKSVTAEETKKLENTEENTYETGKQAADRYNKENKLV